MDTQRSLVVDSLALSLVTCSNTNLDHFSLPGDFAALRQVDHDEEFGVVKRGQFQGGFDEKKPHRRFHVLELIDQRQQAFGGSHDSADDGGTGDVAKMRMGRDVPG